MIAKAKSISRGIKDIELYHGRIEEQETSRTHLLRQGQPAFVESGRDGIWDSMRLTVAKFNRVKNFVIRMEASPAPEYTKNFTIDDWWRMAS